jgi:hypothetical protein
MSALPSMLAIIPLHLAGGFSAHDAEKLDNSAHFPYQVVLLSFVRRYRVI